MARITKITHNGAELVITAVGDDGTESTLSYLAEPPQGATPDSWLSTGGTDNASPTITQDVAVNDTLVVNFCGSRTGFSATDADYTVNATADAGAGGARVVNRSYRRLVTSGAPISPDTITHTTDAVTDWVMFSLAVESAAAPPAPSAARRRRSLLGVGR